MALIKKNIWLVFYVISFLWVIFGALAIYSMSINVYKEYTVEQENVTSMSANSLEAVLNKYEIVLDILAQQLLHQNLYLNEAAVQYLMDIVTQIDPKISAFGVLNPDGTIYIVSANFDIKGRPSLLAREETKDSFLQTLSSSNMVIGRTYFPTDANHSRAIIPLRIAVRDVEGNVKFILSLAIDAQDGFNSFLNNSTENSTEKHEYSTYLFRERDRYFQLASQNRVTVTNTANIFSYQVPESVFKKSVAQIVEQVGLPYETIKQKQMLVSNISKAHQKERLLASIYIKRYELWITTEINTDKIHETIIYKALMLFLVFFSSLLIIYWLFRYIANIEKQKQDDLLYQASHDEITKLYNRFSLEKSICLRNENKPFWLILIDMDDFKAINANYGHESGDLALKMISARLNQQITSKNVLIRYGANEFIIISYKNKVKHIKRLCEDILVSLRQPYTFSWGDFILSASIGVSHYPSDGNSLDEVRRYASLAMQESKKTRNITTFFQDKIKDSQLYNSTLVQELKCGLERHEFYMVYQPKVNSEGQPLGVEALVRWENKLLGFVGPDKFISVAESSGDMIDIGDFIILKSLTDIAELNNQSVKKLFLSVNISVKQFLQPNFIDKLALSLKQTNFDPHNLIIEITETVFIEDTFGMKDTLNQLKIMGIKISLDDFGTGYSSLSLLAKLPIDELKIDKSFVDDIQHDLNAKSMVEGIITIGKKLNLVIVAEGVETLAQLNQLNRMGCDVYQGYYFAKPLTLDDLKRYC